MIMTKMILSWMRWMTGRMEVMSQILWMKMDQLPKVGRSRSTSVDLRMITKEEIIGAAVERSISLILLYIHISKLNIMERHQKEQIPHSFKQVEEEEDLEKFMLRLANKRRIVWTH